MAWAFRNPSPGRGYRGGYDEAESPLCVRVENRAGVTTAQGVDGCAAGWLVVSQQGDDSPMARIAHDAQGIFATGPAAITAIDIPIGLPRDTDRLCDKRARALLGRRKSSVFPAPVRAVLGAKTYVEACEISLSRSGRKLSQQAFALVPKIREIDSFLAEHQSFRTQVIEVHPELSFAVWNGGAAMRYSKRSGFGFLQRFQLVQQEWRDAPYRIRDAVPPELASDDDILDALAALWTARRAVLGAAAPVCEPDQRDDAGLSMNIWA